ncbi:MAG: dephospho-CoA kinase [Actinobacteria bacterium]|nr:dephospho-CoA kinase [Actinomycetota bacterium]MUH57571.1 dephospho-CoA kinase [Actinomycetota bacterium]
MLQIGIAGGIGSGKSTVTAALERAGVEVIDTDIIAREVVEPGKPAWRALVDAFGSAVLDEDNHLDRKFLAAVVFPSPIALRRLNGITHGAIGAEVMHHLDRCRDLHYAVAIPLFRPEHRTLFRLSEVWATEVEPKIAIERLVKHRGFSEEDAKNRISSQISNSERRAIVDVVIPNNETVAVLENHIKMLLIDRGFNVD